MVVEAKQASQMSLMEHLFTTTFSQIKIAFTAQNRFSAG
jgi:hypothetical protein